MNEQPKEMKLKFKTTNPAECIDSIHMQFGLFPFFWKTSNDFFSEITTLWYNVPIEISEEIKNYITNLKHA